MSEQNDADPIPEDSEEETALDVTEGEESLLSALMFPICVLVGLSIAGILFGIAMI